MQKVLIWPYEQMTYAQPRIRLGEKRTKFSEVLRYLISARRPGLVIVDKKKRTRRIVDFTGPSDHREKLKESKKKDKYLDLARELKKLRNMKVTVIPMVIGALDTVTKGLFCPVGWGCRIHRLHFCRGVRPHPQTASWI